MTQPARSSKVTTASLQAMKRSGEKITCLTAYDHLLAGLLDAAGVDLLLVGDSVGTVIQGHDTTVTVTLDQMVYHTEMVRRGAQRALVVGDLPFLSYQVSEEDALRSSGRLLKEGNAEAVKLEGGVEIAPTVSRLVSAGIPVMGHVGLQPQSIHQYGTYKVRGSSEEEAAAILADARALVDAGVFALVAEKIPASLGTSLARECPVPVIGIGSGPDVDGQILVTQDMLGLFDRFRPRFVRRYLELGKTVRDAIEAYGQDVRDGSFPSGEESY